MISIINKKEQMLNHLHKAYPAEAAVVFVLQKDVCTESVWVGKHKLPVRKWKGPECSLCDILDKK